MKAFPEIEGVAFGLVDGLVLVLGLVIGVWAATGDTNTILLAALIGGVSNAFGNSAGTFLSQTAERGVQLQHRRRKGNSEVHSKWEVVRIALFAFGATIATVILVVLPFYFLDSFTATLLSLVIALALLFVLGEYVGRISKEKNFEYGLLYVAIGLVAAVLAFFVGEGLKLFLF